MKAQMMHFFRLIILLAMLITSNAQAQGLFKCKDADGRTVFQELPCKSVAGTSKKIERNTVLPSAQSVATAEVVKSEVSKPATENENYGASESIASRSSASSDIEPDPTEPHFKKESIPSRIMIGIKLLS
jgi:hypothetical protein